MRKNVTITLDAETLRWARKQAAASETSVSRWVGELLAEQMRRSSDQSQIVDDILALMDEIPAGTGYGKRISREAAHERRK